MSQDSPPLLPAPSPAPTAAGSGSMRAAAAWWGAAVLYAALSGRFAPLTAPAEFAVLVAGSAITAWAVGARLSRPAALTAPVAALVPELRRREAPAALGGRGWLAWVAVLAAFLVLEVHSLASATPVDHPSLSAISRPLLAPSDHRSLGYLLWLASGVWVARR